MAVMACSRPRDPHDYITWPNTLRHNRREDKTGYARDVMAAHVQLTDVSTTSIRPSVHPSDSTDHIWLTVWVRASYWCVSSSPDGASCMHTNGIWNKVPSYIYIYIYIYTMGGVKRAIGSEQCPPEITSIHHGRHDGRWVVEYTAVIIITNASAQNSYWMTHEMCISRTHFRSRYSVTVTRSVYITKLFRKLDSDVKTWRQEFLTVTVTPPRVNDE